MIVDDFAFREIRTVAPLNGHKKCKFFVIARIRIHELNGRENEIGEVSPSAAGKGSEVPSSVIVNRGKSHFLLQFLGQLESQDVILFPQIDEHANVSAGVVRSVIIDRMGGLRLIRRRSLILRHSYLQV